MTNKKELKTSARFAAAFLGGALPTILNLYNMDFELFTTFSTAYFVGELVRLIINIILGTVYALWFNKAHRNDIDKIIVNAAIGTVFFMTFMAQVNNQIGKDKIVPAPKMPDVILKQQSYRGSATPLYNTFFALAQKDEKDCCQVPIEDWRRTTIIQDVLAGFLQHPPVPEIYAIISQECFKSYTEVQDKCCELQALYSFNNLSAFPCPSNKNHYVIALATNLTKQQALLATGNIAGITNDYNIVIKPMYTKDKRRYE